MNWYQVILDENVFSTYKNNIYEMAYREHTTKILFNRAAMNKQMIIICSSLCGRKSLLFINKYLTLGKEIFGSALRNINTIKFVLLE